MKLEELRQRAKILGVRKLNRLKKADLIRAIQRKEGNIDCFGTAQDGFCDQKECLWYDDCMIESKK